MYTINNKFDTGEECYTIIRVPNHYECPICEGVGSFEHNGHTIWCRNCNGTGKLHNPNKHEYFPFKVKIRTIKASIHDGVITCRYNTDLVDKSSSRIQAKSRSEAHLFKTLIEAEEYCNLINTNQIKPNM